MSDVPWFDCFEVTKIGGKLAHFVLHDHYAVRSDDIACAVQGGAADDVPDLQRSSCVGVLSAGDLPRLR